MNVVNTNIPVMFQNLQEVDDRFMRVKIWLMHLGQNYNGSSFEKENVEKAIPSLANTPILGFIEDNGSEEDYSDHRIIVTRENGKFQEKYIGQAYGTIPSDNNAKFEFRVGDDGIEREYLTCEGLLWQKWDIPTEIMDRDLVKSQSMELHKDFKGYWNKETEIFHFTDFKFFGACILGSHVMPGMNSASIEKDFSHESFQVEIQDKMEEFKIAFSRYQESLTDDTNKFSKEDADMEKKLLELLAKYSLKGTDVESQIVLADFASEDELEAKIASIAKEFEDAEANKEEDNKKDEDNEKPADQFEAIIATLQSDLDTVKGDFDALKADFAALKEEKESVENKFQELNEEVIGLRNFKDQKSIEERKASEDAIFESFASQLSKDEIESIQSIASDFTLEEIELKLFALVGKKNFTKKETIKEPNKIVFTRENVVDDNYGGILSNYVKS